MNMIEKVARHCERAANPQWTDEEFSIWWNRDPFFCEKETAWPDGFRGTRKQRRIYEARIAIEAMKNPTIGMMKAARGNHEGEFYLPHSLFNSMIDAALSEEKAE